jgi:hypothetical protein
MTLVGLDLRTGRATSQNIIVAVTLLHRPETEAVHKKSMLLINALITSTNKIVL